MKEGFKNIVKLQAMCDTFMILAEYGFTYDDAQDYVDLLQSELRTRRDCREFETADDWANKNPCCDVGNTLLDKYEKRINVLKVFLETEIECNNQLNS